MAPRSDPRPGDGRLSAVELVATPAPTAAEVLAALETLMRVHVIQLREALAAGRLESVLGAARGLQLLLEEAGPPIATAAFARACDQTVSDDRRRS